MRISPLILTLAFCLGCPAPSDPPDYDGDGSPFGVDCDDTDPLIFPENVEICDGIDNDCDGTVDASAADAPIWFVDADGDGYGDDSAQVPRCEQPSGTAAEGGDCDDLDDDAHPGADERCDGVDNDCDGDADDADPEGAVDAAPAWPDADGDGYGDAAGEIAACALPSGHVDDATDCDDADPAVHPAATEICNGADDDCDDGTPEDGVITVDGAENHGALSAAIAAAAVGAEIQICAGVYAGAVTIERSLSIVGLGAVELDAAGDGSVIAIASGDVTLQGLTIIGGTGNPDATGEVWVGGGVDATAADALTLIDCVIEGNSADRGGGLATPASGVASISGTIVRQNSALDLGGGILAQGPVTAQDVEISSNAAPYGGGLYAAGAAVELADSSIADNSAAAAGGGLLGFEGASIALTGSSVTGNTAALQGGGAILLDGSALSSSDTDWGAGADENDPDDVYVGVNAYADFGAAASFACSNETGVCE